MSKIDDMRALREARYAKQAKAPTRRTDPEAGEPALCGHKAIGGRTCTREQGHAAKSHRYS